MTLQTPQEYWASFERARKRAEGEYADNDGAPWHSVSCTCQPCLDADARLIGPGSSRLQEKKLFSGVEA